MDGGTNYTTNTSTCTGTEGYDDMSGGLGVVVYDDTQRIVGNSSLLRGRPSGITTYTTSFSYENCTFAFEVGPLPEVPFYQLEIGTRGRQTM